MENKLIVVVGATGRQGQAVIKSLIKKDYNIRALVRNPEKANELLTGSNVEILIWTTYTF